MVSSFGHASENNNISEIILSVFRFSYSYTVFLVPISVYPTSRAFLSHKFFNMYKVVCISGISCGWLVRDAKQANYVKY